MNAVYAVRGMAHWGRIIAEARGWQLFIECPVGDVENVHIVGMYDPPYYTTTLANTAKAKHRHISWHGTDVQMLARPEFLPDATHSCCSEGLKAELLAHGIDAKVVPVPSTLHPVVSPLPEKPTVAVYFGSNPDQYGAGMVRALQEVLDCQWITYQYGQYSPEQMHTVIRESTVYLRLTQHDGSCVSAREFMEAGRYAVCSSPMKYAKQVNPEDLQMVLSAVRKALKNTEPDAEAAAYYADYNSTERFLEGLEACDE